MAAALRADFIVMRGSRHDSTEATNAALLALLKDQPLPAAEQCVCDGPEILQRIEWACELAVHEQRAASSRPARVAFMHGQCAPSSSHALHYGRECRRSRCDQKTGRLWSPRRRRR